MTPDSPDARPIVPMRSRGSAVGLNEQWFVTTETGRREGPYSAAQVARFLEQGVLGWTSQIWREGLKDWRPARRDDLLVFAVASARGMASDTSRVDMLAEILQDDTFVQDEPPAALPRPAEPAAAPQQLEAFQLEPPPALASRPVVSVTPPLGASASPRGPHWLLRYSTPLIAVLAFASGVLLTQVSRRFTGPTPDHEPAALGTREVAPSQATLTRAPAAASPAPAMAPAAAAAVVVSKQRTQPEPEELQAELARLTPAVHRCARRLASLEVALVLDGKTGHPRGSQLRAKGMRGGRLACLARALSGLTVAPFSETSYRVTHRFRF